MTLQANWTQSKDWEFNWHIEDGYRSLAAFISDYGMYFRVNARYQDVYLSRNMLRFTMLDHDMILLGFVEKDVAVYVGKRIAERILDA